jgi:hypothetical protein
MYQSDVVRQFVFIYSPHYGIMYSWAQLSVKTKETKMAKKTLLEKAGLKKFSVASATKADLNARILKINALMEKDQVNTYLRKKLTDHRWACEQKLNGQAARKKRKHKKIDTNQMALPGFLRQMDVVRFEELIANNVRKEIASLVKPARKTSKKSA